MTEFRKAPDGQPTENIELQLRVAKARLQDDVRYLDDMKRRIITAENMLRSTQHRVDELEWQLEQRRIA